MILEVDFTNKTIKVKGMVKVSELMAKIKELNLDEDYNLIMDSKTETRDNFYPVYPQYPTYPQWWETQPYYETTNKLFYVGDTMGGNPLNKWEGVFTDVNINNC